MAPVCALVVCGAPLASRAGDVAAALVKAGWEVRVILTPAAESWVDAAAIEAAASEPASSKLRAPNSPKPSRPDAVAVVPMTFNTAGKAAHGIADTAAHSAIAEALGRRVPVVAVPMVNEHLAENPAWTRNVAALTAAGMTWVSMTDGTRGPAEAVPSGTGEELAAQFDPEWVVGHLPDGDTGGE